MNGMLRIGALSVVGIVWGCSTNAGQEPAPGRLGQALSPPDQAEIVDFNLPLRMNCGEQAPAWVRLLNIGDSTWTTDAFSLSTIGDGDPFGAPRIPVPHDVGSYEEALFSFTLRAPATSGTPRWKMFHAPSTWFGPIVSQAITVDCNAPSYAAALSTVDFPSNVGCGETFDASVAFTNTGSQTWSESAGDALVATDPQDPFERPDRVPVTGSVPVGADGAFHIRFTAPPIPGQFSTTWRMSHGSQLFGSPFVRNISVACTPLVDRADIGSNIPASASCRERFSANISAHNSGTTTWSSDAPHPYTLRLLPGSPPVTDAVRPLPTYSVAPGQTADFSASFRAPSEPGDYTIGFQMYAGDAPFPASFSQNLHVTCAEDDARLTESSLPSEVGCGRPYPVHLKYKNVGYGTWSAAGGYSLVNPTGRNPFLPFNSVVQMAANVSVQPDQEYSFDFTLQAPYSPGAGYVQIWVPWRANKGEFGTRATQVVNVHCDANVAEAQLFDLQPSFSCGSSQSARIVFKNQGSLIWDENYSIIATGDALGPSSIPLPAGRYVIPGEIIDMRFDVPAPYQSGTRHVSYRMYDRRTGVFGQAATRDVALSCLQRDAHVESVVALPAPTCESQTSFQVTVRNTGLSTWSSLSPGTGADVASEIYAFSEIALNGFYATNSNIPLTPGTVVRPGQTTDFVVTLTRNPIEGARSRAFFRMTYTTGGAAPSISTNTHPFGSGVRIGLKDCGPEKDYASLEGATMLGGR